MLYVTDIVQVAYTNTSLADYCYQDYRMSMGKKSRFFFIYFHSINTYRYATFIYIQDGFTPLHWASQNGHTDIVKQLLKAGANPHALTKVSCMVMYRTGYSSDIYPKLFNGYFHSTNLFRMHVKTRITCFINSTFSLTCVNLLLE